MKVKSLIIAGILGTAMVAQGNLIVGGFGTLTLETDSTTDLNDAGGTAWYNQNNSKPPNFHPFEGTMTTTTLTVDNDPFETNSRKYETATARIINNTGSGSSISFSFDYNVSQGSPSIYFHLKGVDVTGASPDWQQAMLGRGGAAFHTEENNTDTFNLFDGTNPADSGAAAIWGYNGGLLNQTGSGTVSATIDLSGHATHTDLSNYEYLAVAFAFDFDEVATIEISNFSLNDSVVPEPSTLALLGMGGAILMATRRRQNRK